jgi:predicted nucleotide-binding protein
MLERFQGEEGSRRQRQALLDQQCVAHDEAIVEALMQKVELVFYKSGGVLIEQGTYDNDMFFILTGRVSIQVNGRELAIRQCRQHVGEMALIDAAPRRSATVVALEETVVAKISEPSFTAIANAYPQLWRRLAMELGDRLRQRSAYVSAPNPRPVIFIGSSSEGLQIAQEIQAGLCHDNVVPKVWTDNVFVPGHGTVEDLEACIQTSDFGVLVCTQDDEILNENRNVNMYAPRDNVIVELGMCLGALGRRRTLLVTPRTRALKIPTDLLGITVINYTDADPGHLTTHIGAVCTQIRKVVEKLGAK